MLICSLINPLTTNDTLALSVFGHMLSVGATRFALAERVGQGEVDGCTALADSALQLLELAVDKPWSVLGGLFVCFLAQIGAESGPFTL